MSIGLQKILLLVLPLVVLLIPLDGSLSVQVASAVPSCVTQSSGGEMSVPTCQIYDLTPACQASNNANSPECSNDDDRAVIGNMGGAQAVFSSAGPPAKCSIIRGTWSLNDCIWVPLMSSLGGFFLAIGAGALQIVGLIFDLLIWKVVVGFGAMLNNNDLTGAINTGWRLFRDVSNIAIIGMFVFIALCLTMGIKSFGQRKLVARVIIVALLLNFSLLFTRMVIDFSNFTAYQFYAAAAARQPQHTATQGGKTEFDIAKAFLAPMGISSILNTSGVVHNVAMANGQSGWLALMYGLTGGAMLFSLAAVLAYGCYVIALRAVLFIVLMITAALAFATHLIPQFASGGYGFQAWWRSLLNAAIFAPLLMLFLFVSLEIVRAGQAVLPGSSLNAFLTKPGMLAENATPSIWMPILNFIIVGGLLYASFKISSKVASAIPGGQLPQQIARFGTAVVAGTIGGMVGGPAAGAGAFNAMRQGGQPAAGAGGRSPAGSLTGAPMVNLPTGANNTTSGWSRFGRGAGQGGAVGVQARVNTAPSFSRRLANNAITRIAKDVEKRASGDISAVRAEATKSSGPGINASDAQKGFDSAKSAEQSARAQAQDATRRAEIASKERDEAKKTLDTETIKAVRASANPAYNEEKGSMADAEQKQAEITNELKKAFSEQLVNVSDALKVGLQDRVNAMDKGTVLDADSMRKLREDITSAVADPAAQSRVRSALGKAEGERASTMRHEEENIKRAREAVIKKVASDPNLLTQLKIFQQTYETAEGHATVEANDAQHYARLHQDAISKMNEAQKTLEKTLRDSVDAVHTTVEKVAEQATRAGNDNAPETRSISSSPPQADNDNHALSEAEKQAMRQRNDMKQLLNRIAQNTNDNHREAA